MENHAVKIDPSNLKNLLFGTTTVKGASFTVKSLETGKDFTFKIERNEFLKNMYTHVKVEKNYLDFYRLGTYSKGVLKHKQEEVHTPAADAAAWILRQIEKNNMETLREKVEVYHLGKCLRCGRSLTDAHSIETGFGPYCRGVVND